MGISESIIEFGDTLVEFGFPSAEILRYPTINSSVPPSPFQNEKLTQMYHFFMKSSTPMTIAIVYFTSVHLINQVIRKRQSKLAAKSSKTDKKTNGRLPAAPLGIAKTWWFKLFVLLHNVFLCIYSGWTFFGMVSTMKYTSRNLKSQLPLTANNFGSFSRLVQSICDLDQGIFASNLPWKNLHFYGFWFYLSKFYEVLDTIIILMKGRPSSLLQSYHHAGAMMSMWAGIRFHSPPIWIFVVFNSFIHTLMYFYFSLSCLKIHVPNVFKRTLTSMQITQFVVGGSIAVVHAFLKYTNLETGSKQYCIESSERAFPLFINVAYLTPLTALFAAFYVDSYLKRSSK